MSLAWSGPSMRAALEEAKPGCCVFCDAPVRKRTSKSHRLDRPRKRLYPLLCGRPDCLTAYHTAYKQDWRAAGMERAGGG